MMNRFSVRALVAVASLAMVVAMTHVADAQREGGRGGRGGRGFGRGGGFGLSLVQLARADEVQAALNLSDEQKEKVDTINDDLRQDQRDLRDQGGDFSETIAEMQKLNGEATAKLTEVLDEVQNKRLLGILAQVDVGSALNNSTIAKDLNIADEQKEALSDAREGNRDAIMKVWRDQDLSREERETKLNEVRTEAGKKLLAALTTEQQTQYEALKGEPVEVDMSQFRMGGGRGRRGGRGGEGREGRGGDGGRGGEGGSAESSDSDSGT